VESGTAIVGVNSAIYSNDPCSPASTSKRLDTNSYNLLNELLATGTTPAYAAAVYESFNPAWGPAGGLAAFKSVPPTATTPGSLAVTFTLVNHGASASGLLTMDVYYTRCACKGRGRSGCGGTAPAGVSHPPRQPAARLTRYPTRPAPPHPTPIAPHSDIRNFGSYVSLAQYTYAGIAGNTYWTGAYSPPAPTVPGTWAVVVVFNYAGRVYAEDWTARAVVLGSVTVASVVPVCAAAVLSGPAGAFTGSLAGADASRLSGASLCGRTALGSNQLLRLDVGEASSATAPAGRKLTVLSCAVFDTVLYVGASATGACPATVGGFGCAGVNDDAAVAGCAGAGPSRVVLTLAAGARYFNVLVSSYGGIGSGPFSLAWQTEPPPPTCRALGGLSGSATDTTALYTDSGLTGATLGGACGGVSAPRGVTRLYVLDLGPDDVGARDGGSLAVSTCGSSIDTVLWVAPAGSAAWYCPASPAEFVCAAASDDAGQPGCAPVDARVTLPLPAGGRFFHVLVAPYSASAVGTIKVNWALTLPSPSQSPSPSLGASTTATVTGSRSRPPTRSRTPSPTGTPSGTRTRTRAPASRSRTATRTRSRSRSRTPTRTRKPKRA
jgi:hypothetical protein